MAVTLMEKAEGGSFHEEEEDEEGERGVVGLGGGPEGRDEVVEGFVLDLTFAVDEDDEAEWI